MARKGSCSRLERGLQISFGCGTAQVDINDIGQRQAISIERVFNLEHSLSALDDPLAIEKTHRQLSIMARSTHNYGQALLIDTYLKWLFDRQEVLALSRLILLPARDIDAHNAL